MSVTSASHETKIFANNEKESLSEDMDDLQTKFASKTNGPLPSQKASMQVLRDRFFVDEQLSSRHL